MSSPNAAVRRLWAVWAASLAWKIAALAVFLAVVLRLSGGGGW